jgi:hypothetical protein
MFEILPWQRKKESDVNILQRKIDNIYNQFFKELSHGKKLFCNFGYFTECQHG